MQQPSAAALDESRTQQRAEAEQHSSSSEDTSVAADGAAAAAALISASFSPAQLFHTDGLHSVFAYLAFCELPTLAAVCKGCSAALAQETSRECCWDCSTAQLLRMSQSPLRRHVRSLTVRGALHVSQLLHLRELPALKELSLYTTYGDFISIAAASGGPSVAAARIACMFPGSITSLAIQLDSDAQSADARRLLVDIVAHMGQLTCHSVDAADGSALQLLPLYRLPLLQSLTLLGAGWCLSKLLVKQMAALRSLTFLNVDNDEASGENQGSVRGGA